MYGVFSIFSAIVLFQGTESKQYISIIKNETSWNNAEAMCQECGGKLITWNDDTETIAHMLNRTGRELNGFWIGDYQPTESTISFEGCANENVLLISHDKYVLNKNNQELCKIACQEYIYFGIKNKTCICFDKEHFEKGCRSEAEESNSILCKEEEMEVFSDDVVLRCTFDDCRCNNSVDYASSWTKSNRCFGNAGLADDLSDEQRNIKHKKCIVISNSAQIASFNINVAQQKREFTYCLSLMYYMNGLNMESLVVEIKEENNTSGYNIWRAEGNHGNIWKEGHAEFYGKGPFKISIYGKVTSNCVDQIQNYMAIDNITVTIGKCKESHRDIDCSFEVGMCGWTQPFSSQLKWVRISGSTGTTNTGPERDRRSTAGSYIYIESHWGNNEATADLYSPIISTTTRRNYCLKFWYHMYGTNVAYLRVFLMVPSTSRRRVWEKIGPQNRAWHQVSVDISNSNLFSIIFRAKKTGNRGDIAIDDITLLKGTCEEGSKYSFVHLCPVVRIISGKKSNHMDDCSKLVSYLGICERNESNYEYAEQNCNFISIAATTKSVRPTQRSSVLPSTNNVDVNSTASSMDKRSDDTEDTKKSIVGLHIFAGVMCALVIGLIVALVLVALKYKRSRISQRNQAPIPDNSMPLTNINYNHQTHSVAEFPPGDSTQRNKPKNEQVTGNHRSYKNASAILADDKVEKTVQKSKVKTENVTGNSGSYEFASAILPDDVIKNSNTSTADRNKADDIDMYQNAICVADDDYVYTENEAGEYDHIGNTEKRRIISKNSKDQTYAHAVGVNKSAHGNYDTTTYNKGVSVTDDSGYFVLEKEEFNRSSNLYDHMSETV